MCIKAVKRLESYAPARRSYNSSLRKAKNLFLPSVTNSDIILYNKKRYIVQSKIKELEEILPSIMCLASCMCMQSPIQPLYFIK